MLWDRVLNWMEAPSEVMRGNKHAVGVGVSGKVGGSAGVPFVAKGSVEASATGRYGSETESQRTFARAGIDQVVREIAGSDYVVFIDDFHYMTADVQKDVARQIKEAAEKNVSICTASVPHRADDVVRSNVELRGRVKAIDFDYWTNAEVAEIGRRGFEALNLAVPAELIEQLASEAFGSPQLMQQMCLQTCYYFDHYERSVTRQFASVGSNALKSIFEITSTTTDFSSLLDALHAGPKQRGTTRNQFKFVDGSSGDVYRCILLAIQRDPSQLSFTYDDIYQRTRNVCEGDSPPGSSVAQALEQLETISNTIQPTAPVVEWSEDVLDIVDPYFLFYLRGSNRLSSIRKS